MSHKERAQSALVRSACKLKTLNEQKRVKFDGLMIFLYVAEMSVR